MKTLAKDLKGQIKSFSLYGLRFIGPSGFMTNVGQPATIEAVF